MPLELCLHSLDLARRRLAVDMTAIIGFQPIIPKGSVVDVARMRRELEGAMMHFGNLVRDDFRKTVAGWQTQVDFGNDQRYSGGDLEQEVATDSRIYGYVDQGTIDHYVGPRNAGSLAFQTGYRPATRPHVISSRGASRFGPMAFSKGHWVSGIEPRRFATTIADRRWHNLNVLCQNAVRQALH